MTDAPASSGVCWKTTGVFSSASPTCKRLGQVIHCRNCEVFTRAGRNLLDREIPEVYRDEWAEAVAVRKEEEPPGTVSVVIFRVGREWLAIRTRLFARVIEPQKFHSLPHRRNSVLLGLVNVHGELRLCVSLQHLLHIRDEPEKKSKRRIYPRMIVVRHNGEEWVFPAEELHGVTRIPPGRFQNVPATVERAPAAFTRAIFTWKDRDVALLDDELLLMSLTRSVQ